MFKNIICLFVVLFFVSSCEKSENESSEKGMEYALVLEGEWICETQMQWEVMEFSRTGKCFYYNGVVAWNVENIHKCDGLYFIEGDNITGQCYSLNGYVNWDFTILTISDNEFEAKHNKTGVVKTYHRVIKEYELKPGETIKIDNSSLLASDIKQLKSHDNNIAIVDNNTGEVIAGNGGLVLIDVITENNDIAYIKVKVNGIMDLTPYLNLKQENVFTIFGTPTTIDGMESLYYSVRDNLTDYVQFHFNSETEVQMITLKLIEGSLEKETIQEQLDRMYIKDNNNISNYFVLYYTSNSKIGYFPEYNTIYFSQR